MQGVAKPKRVIRRRVTAVSGVAKGQQHRRTIKLKRLTQAAVDAGITPLEYMLGVIRAPAPVRGEKESDLCFAARVEDDASFRLAAARYAAPYVHPRIATEIKVTTPLTQAKPIDVLEVAKSVAFLFTMAEHRKTIDVAPERISQH